MVVLLSHALRYSPRFYHSIQEEPSNDCKNEVDYNLPPHHVDVDRPPWVRELHSLLDGCPYGEEAEAKGESCSHTRYFEVVDRGSHCDGSQ